MNTENKIAIQLRRFNKRKIKFIEKTILSKPWTAESCISHMDYILLQNSLNNYREIVKLYAFKEIKFGWNNGVHIPDDLRPTKLEGKLTREWLLENFRYEPHTGNLIQLRSRSITNINKPVTKKQTAGYPYISVNGRNYLVHRCAWLMQTGSWPSKWIDHINGIRDDNRWSNLREASHQDNLRYRPKPKSNTTGYKNIQFFPSGSYKVVISLNQLSRLTVQKVFKNLEDALEYRDAKLIEHFGEFAYLDYPVGHPKHMPFPTT